MTAAWLGLMLLLWAGTALARAGTSWPARPIAGSRIARYLPGSHLGSGAIDGPPPTSIRLLVAGLGDRAVHLLGIDDDLSARLERAHRPISHATARQNQISGAAAALVLTAVVASAAPVPPFLGLPAVALAPVVAIWGYEQRITAAARSWQRRLFLELPGACEQLGLLLGSGYSLGAALGRLGSRGGGAVARDLRRVTRRIRQGLDEHQALAEWARLAQVPALDRLVAVLSLDRQTGDLSRLIAEEARSVRLEVHREVLSEVRRRAQQVWIPVTVAALVPGAIFLAVPFVQALDIYAGR